jgi:hypothetical protein
MRRFVDFGLVLALLLLPLSAARADVTFSVGTDDFYISVGNYDYLPYAYQTSPGYAAPRISFYDVMSEYGSWGTVSPFGRVWRPYASRGWRPYTYGHWIYTQYGPMWEGYEPWAWVGYHYGDWIFVGQYGWVWIPGYEWHPGRVAWARSYDSLGWMPLPPAGYDYSRGYLSQAGPLNQFAYNDPDFGVGVNTGEFNYGGPYYDPGYRDMFYNPSYSQISINLWVFVDNDHFGSDNYADYNLGPQYTQYVFDHRLVRITNQPLDRSILERVVRHPIVESPVEVSELQVEKQTVRVVVPTGRDAVEGIRRHSKEVVRNVIAPGFAEARKAFRGQNSKNEEGVTRLFNQEHARPKMETLSSQEVISRAHQAELKRENARQQRLEVAKAKVAGAEKKGVIREPKPRQQKDSNQKDDRKPSESSQPAVDQKGFEKQGGQEQPDRPEARSPGKPSDVKTDVPANDRRYGFDDDRSKAQFADLDQNHDNRITPNEWPFDSDSFRRADHNQDGAVSRAEFLNKPEPRPSKKPPSGSK